MNFKDWFLDLQTRTAQHSGAGLVAFKRLLARLGNPQNSYKIVHVAGTNGKGTVCTLLARILSRAGEKTGLFISPHLISPTERIQIDNEEISLQDLHRIVEKVLAQEQEPLNFFELITAAAFVYFAEKRVKYAVLETGLGGRKDPTNVCVPVLSIITSIGLDHTHILGDTLEQIATEKAGIIKSGVPVLCGHLPHEAAWVIENMAREKNVPLERICAEKRLGNAQAQNAQLARCAAKQLKIADETITGAIETAQLPGRFEIFRRNSQIIILDGAHNLPALENLLAFWQTTVFAKQRAVILCGFMQDKDYPGMLRALTAQFERGVVTAVPSPRAASKAQLAPLLPVGWEFMADVSAALTRAGQQADIILVTGSFYLVGAVRAQLTKIQCARNLKELFNFRH